MVRQMGGEFVCKHAFKYIVRRMRLGLGNMQGAAAPCRLTHKLMGERVILSQMWVILEREGIRVETI